MIEGETCQTTQTTCIQYGCGDGMVLNIERTGCETIPVDAILFEQNFIVL